MTFPTFLVIGAQKAATTSLHAYLGSHPDVGVSGHKELDFFSRQWHMGGDWYESNFPADGEAKAVGEASPSYAAFPLYPGVPERIYRLMPDVRLIYVLRHPIERMRSSYLHGLAMGAETKPMHEALLSDPWYVSLSQYSLQIELYLDHFERSQLLILQSEELSRDPASVMTRVFDFLDVDPAWVPPNLGQRFHVSEQKRVPRRSARAAGHAMIWTQTRLLHRPYYPDTSRPSPAWVDRYLTRPVHAGELRLDRETSGILTRWLRPDLTRLVGHVGGTFDAWGLL